MARISCPKVDLRPEFSPLHPSPILYYPHYHLFGRVGVEGKCSHLSKILNILLPISQIYDSCGWLKLETGKKCWISPRKSRRTRLTLSMKLNQSQRHVRNRILSSKRIQTYRFQSIKGHNPLNIANNFLVTMATLDEIESIGAFERARNSPGALIHSGSLQGESDDLLESRDSTIPEPGGQSYTTIEDQAFQQFLLLYFPAQSIS